MTVAHRRIGVFGGAFDPPHLAHVALAQAALDQLNLHELKVIPTGQAWHKSRTLSSAEHRLAMARLAFSQLPHTTVDDRETRRSGPSYTIDTLRELHAQYPGCALFLLLGADQARALSSWKNYTEIPQYATICVAERQDPAEPKGLPTRRFSGDSFWTENSWLALAMQPSDTSATLIRAQAAAQNDVSPLVGSRVARYIALNRLYQPTPSTHSDPTH